LFITSNLKNLRWWMLPFKKIVNAISQLLFYGARHICVPKLMSNQEIENFTIQIDRWRPTRKLRNWIVSFYSLLKNSRNSANNRFHAKRVKYSTFYDILADVWPILMKFWWNFAWWHILAIQGIRVVYKVKFKKIQDSGCCHLKNC